ncbi:hypothetical protein [Mesorhizobium kowhaii]|nr:hypothetical protein [Mesorhizobium kowhaii]
MVDSVIVPATETSIELDEPGPVIITITPPWLIMEAVHVVEIE